MTAHKHHYVPKFLLAGFTPEGTEDGPLFVVDQRIGKTWRSTPRGAAHQRDFYQVDVPGMASDAFEQALSRIESQASAVIRDCLALLRPPTGAALEDLIRFATVMAVRTPPMREHWGNEEGELLRRCLEITLRNPKGAETLKGRARAEGRPSDNASPEQSLDKLAQSDIEFPSTWGVARLLQHAEAIYPMLARRRWSLLVAEAGAGHFICSDMPAVNVDPTPRPAFFSGHGFAAPEAEFTLPLGRNVALFGHAERESDTYAADAMTVAGVNRRSGMYASKLYSPTAEFTLLRPDGTIGSVADLLTAVSEHLAGGSGLDERGEEG